MRLVELHPEALADLAPFVHVGADERRKLRSMTTARGVFAGASMPHQPITSNPGRLDSAIVGTSGIATERCNPPLASARKRPAFACGMPTAIGVKDIWTSFASCAVIAGAMPL